MSSRDACLRELLLPLSPFLEDNTITEICINAPGTVWVEAKSSWQKTVLPAYDLQALKDLCDAVSCYVKQEITPSAPILSATLPDQERIQIVYPPACPLDTVSITIRKPSSCTPSLDQYEAQGFFQSLRKKTHQTEEEERLRSLRETGDYKTFFREAVLLQKVIVVCGETGSGKTTFMKALIAEIPKEERLITIEDVPELLLPSHPNKVHLYYPSEAKEENSQVTAASLLKSCLRMKPTRILLGELRGGETFDFLNVASSGHGGTITSCHAGSPKLAFERLGLMVLQNRQGRTLPYQTIQSMLHEVIDIVVHIHHDIGGLGRHITKIWTKGEAL